MRSGGDDIVAGERLVSRGKQVRDRRQFLVAYYFFVYIHKRLKSHYLLLLRQSIAVSFIVCLVYFLWSLHHLLPRDLYLLPPCVCLLCHSVGIEIWNLGGV